MSDIPIQQNINHNMKYKLFFPKDGSWNSMISAHVNGQIFANMGICPYSSLGEEKTPYFP